MILSDQTRAWPLHAEREDLAQSWFEFLVAQTQTVALAAESAAHAGLDAGKPVQQLLAELDSYVQQVRFNASLAKLIRARRKGLGLPAPASLEAAMNNAEAALARLVDMVKSQYAFVIEVLDDAGLRDGG